jgi:hypothetical protein
VITEAGADLLPVLNALLIWGEKHTSAPQPGAHMGIVHRTCGAESTSADRCSNCGEPLTAAEVSWSRSWRGPDPQPLTPAR